MSITPTYFDSSADIEASPSLHQPTPVMGVRIESQFWESPFFGLLQQINKVLLIPVFFACLGSFFPRNYYSGLSIICTQVYQMVATLTTVAWWFGQFPYIVRRTPHPELGPTRDFGARPDFFYYSLCINYLLCNDCLIIIMTIISGLHYILCTGK